MTVNKVARDMVKEASSLGDKHARVLRDKWELRAEHYSDLAEETEDVVQSRDYEKMGKVYGKAFELMKEGERRG